MPFPSPSSRINCVNLTNPAFSVPHTAHEHGFNTTHQSVRLATRATFSQRDPSLLTLHGDFVSSGGSAMPVSRPCS